MDSQTQARLDRCHVLPEASIELILFSLSTFLATKFIHKPDFAFLLEKCICHVLGRRKILNFYNYLCVGKAQVFNLVMQELLVFFEVEFQNYQSSFKISQLLRIRCNLHPQALLLSPTPLASILRVGSSKL